TFAINTISGPRCGGVGRTAVEVCACTCGNRHWPAGTTSALVRVSSRAPEGWTLGRYPPPRRRGRLTTSALALCALVSLTVPPATPEEVETTIMHSLPYMGGRRQ